MPSRNYVELIGHLGRKPELRRTKTGAPVASFSIATNESWYDEKQQLRERTEWHRVVVWGKPAETVAHHLDVGRLVLVEGQLRTREYADKQGARRVVTEVHARPGPRRAATMTFPSSSLRSGRAVRPLLTPQAVVPMLKAAASSLSDAFGR